MNKKGEEEDGRRRRRRRRRRWKKKKKKKMECHYDLVYSVFIFQRKEEAKAQRRKEGQIE